MLLAYTMWHWLPGLVTSPSCSWFGVPPAPAPDSSGAQSFLKIQDWIEFVLNSVSEDKLFQIRFKCLDCAQPSTKNPQTWHYCIVSAQRGVLNHRKMEAGVQGGTEGTASIVPPCGRSCKLAGVTLHTYVLILRGLCFPNYISHTHTHTT